MNTQFALAFDLVFSADDFFLSVDKLPLVRACTEFSVRDSGEIVFYKQGKPSPFQTLPLPGDLIDAFRQRDRLLFASFDKGDITLAVEMRRH